MTRKTSMHNHLLMSRGLSRIIPAFICAIIYICGGILAAPTTYAEGVPGGNIDDSVVRAVDIAKPAVVRIIAKATGRLTVDLPTTAGIVSVTFPQGGGSYTLQYLGSGAFINAHGNILTANHLVQPDQGLYDAAAQDIADYINTRFKQNITANDVLVALSNGIWKSHPQYAGTPTMRVYLSTDFTGPMNNVTSLAAMPQGTYADVDNVLKTNDFEHGDTAIIHVPMDDTPSIKLDDSTNVEPQDQLTVLGFPGHGDFFKANATTLTGAINPSTGFFTMSLNKVYVSALKQNDNGTPLIQVGGNVEQGDSGGPALDSGGNIVGVVSFGRVDNGVTNDTNFLQASNSAQKLIDALQLDTRPGTFESAWTQAFAQYSSTQPGHWHNAQLQMQKLQSNYPNFHAIQPFLNYATTQASKESTTNTTSTNLLLVIGIVLIALVVIFLVLFLARRKKGPQMALATQSASYQSPYGSSSAIEPISPSGSMDRIDLKDGAGQDIGITPDGQLAQPRATQSQPLVPQTPTPVAAYDAFQSGPVPVVPNQPPMNPWPQQVGYGSAPAYGQRVPYGQQPYNTAPQPGPIQAMPNTPYSPQQQPYAPYPQAPVPPWPPAPTNTPLPHARGPYTPQNPAQQGAPMQYEQQLPNYGIPYNQAPQGYGAMPAPAQPRPVQPAQSSQQSSEPIPAQPQRASAPLIPDASTPSQEPTVRVDPSSRSAARKRVKPTEGTENTASATPALPKDETEIATTLGEGDAPTE
jgi:S1-C subfamily serine protease